MVRILLLLLATIAIFGASVPIDDLSSQHLLNNIKLIERHNANPNKTFYSKRDVRFVPQAIPAATRASCACGDRSKDQRSLIRRNVTYYKGSNSVSGPPVAVNWTARGVVNRVKYQGKNCGADWAFSVIGALESQHAIQKGSRVDLSEQNLVDCMVEDYTNGVNNCLEGQMPDAYEYIINNGGIDTEPSYPYVDKQQPCKFRKDTVGEKMSSYTLILRVDDEDLLMQAVAYIGPVSVAIDASNPSFQNYGGGIYYEPACKVDNVNLALLASGYDEKSGAHYWILKNSFGPNWGEQGYMRLARNRNNFFFSIHYILPVLDFVRLLGECVFLHCQALSGGSSRISVH